MQGWIGQKIDWMTVLSRTLLLAILWWALSDGDPGSWWVGIPAALAAAIASVALLPPVRLAWREVLRFIPFFLRHSLQGGADVAWRAVHPRLPVAPGIIDYPLRLPPGASTVMLINILSLLPGTLSVELEGRVLKVHVLDSLRDSSAEVEELEQRVASFFGVALGGSGGGECA